LISEVVINHFHHRFLKEGFISPMIGHPDKVIQNQLFDKWDPYKSLSS